MKAFISVDDFSGVAVTVAGRTVSMAQALANMSLDVIEDAITDGMTCQAVVDLYAASYRDAFGKEWVIA